MLFLIPILLLVGALFYAVTWIESGAVARVEASNIAKAAEVQRHSSAVAETLRIQAEQISAQRDADAQVVVAAVRLAEARAKDEAELHAAAAQSALALVDEIEGQVCPPPPKPTDPCSWLCSIPELESQ